MNMTNMESKIVKVDFLPDYEKSFDYFQKLIESSDKILIIRLLLNGNFEYQYSSFEELKEKFNHSDYVNVNVIDILYKKPDESVVSLHCDKEQSSIVFLKSGNSIKDVSKESELTKMLNDSIVTENVIQNDGCTYYHFFNNDNIGKYNPNTKSYYLLNEKGEWEVSGAVMRWVIDSAYDYVVIASPEDSFNIKKGEMK